MEHGGAWMDFILPGSHLTPTKYPQNWDWYHNDFLGRALQEQHLEPPRRFLRVEDAHHPAPGECPRLSRSATNE